MIKKSDIEKVVIEHLNDTDYFLVDVSISSDNRILVEIDSYHGVNIDFCIVLSRKIEEAFDREQEDYELEVGSAGLTSPFKVAEQYKKNIGNEVELLTKKGQKYTGILTSAEEKSFVLTTEQMEKPEGHKRKIKVQKEFSFEIETIKYIKHIIRFK